MTGMERKRPKLRLAVLTTVFSLAAGAASAQTVAIATTKGGATAQVSAAIAKIVSSKSKLQMRTQPMGGTQQYIPIVNAGEIEFGLSNAPQYWMAKTGTGLSKRKYDDLRLVANMMMFQVAPVVTVKSGIRSIPELRGKRVPHGFKAAPLFSYLVGAFLANGGLSYNDVTKVPSVALRQQWDMFGQGKIDMSFGAIGTGRIKELNAKIDGGVRHLSLDPSDKAAKATAAVYPRSYIKKVMPRKGLVGVDEPIYALSFDYVLWTQKRATNDTVYLVVKAMYEHEKALRETSPLWRSFHAKNMAKNFGTPYHPGAIRFYKQVGLMK